MPWRQSLRCVALTSQAQPGPFFLRNDGKRDRLGKKVLTVSAVPVSNVHLIGSTYADAGFAHEVLETTMRTWAVVRPVGGLKPRKMLLLYRSPTDPGTVV